MYNAYLATRQKARKQKEDSPATAGMAKSPAGGPKSREELKAMGERNGWSVRELSLREINAMSADEVLWHETFSRENFDNAFARGENQRVNRENQAIWDIRKKWAGTVGVTPEAAEEARKAGQEFALRTPTFARTLDNAMKIVKWLEENDRDATDLHGYFNAFRTLSAAGELELVKPQSADEYLAEHPELENKRVPPLIAARHQREQNTEAHFANAASATSEASVTRVVDYGEQKRGVPPESEKYSFKMKVRAMSADELAQRCADDPAFKTALDALE